MVQVIFSSKGRLAKFGPQCSGRKNSSDAKRLDYSSVYFSQSFSDVAQFLIFVLCKSMFNGSHEIFMDEFLYLVSFES